MTTPTKEIVYKDIDNAFTAHPITKKLNVLTNANAIKQSVKNIVLTNFYERPYNARFGGNLVAQLFENGDAFTEYNVSANIRQALRNWEPRALVEKIVVDFVEDSNDLQVSITFRAQNLKDPITTVVNLQRVR